MPTPSGLNDALKRKNIAALHVRAAALDKKLRQIKGKRPTMQEIVKGCRIVRGKMHLRTRATTLNSKTDQKAAAAETLSPH